MLVGVIQQTCLLGGARHGHACHTWDGINFRIIWLFHNPNVSCLNRMNFRYSKLVCKKAVCTRLTDTHKWMVSSTHRSYRCLLQLAKLSLSGDFFRWENLHFVNEIPPQTNADSHEFYCLCCWIFYIDVESILNVFDVSIACRNENYRSVLSSTHCLLLMAASENVAHCQPQQQNSRCHPRSSGFIVFPVCV